MFNMSNFQPSLKETTKVDTNSDISKCMDVFQRTEAQFLPPGKDFDDLTEGELAQLKRQYRFDYYKPGSSNISGFGKMIN